MADTSKTRMVMSHCLHCGKHVALYVLRPGIEFKLMGPADSIIQEKTCPNCNSKAKYPASLWEEVELP